MKLLLLIGGLMGFLIGIGFGLIHEKSLPSALLHACVTMYVAGLLMRWWGRVWMKNLAQAHRERRHG